MKCMKCNHVLPDDSEFCQYCGNRIEKIAVIPEVDATMVVDEAATAAASDVPVKDDVVASASAETPKQSAEEVIPPLPDFKNMEPDEALKAMLRFYAKETIGDMNANSQSQPDQESEMDFGLVPEKPINKYGAKALTKAPQGDIFDHGDVPEKACKAKKVKQPKKKYCSRCGTLIDHQSKQCTGCGKKYFKGIRFNKFTVTIIVFLLVIAASISLNVYQYLDNQELHDQVGHLESRLEGAQSSINRLISEKADQRNQNVGDAMERLFFHSRAEIVGDDGSNLYHKYGCEKLDTSNGYWILNTEAAQGEGYIECQHCH